MRVDLFVPGEAKSQGSVSAFVSRTTGKLIAPQKDPLMQWRTRVAYFAQQARIAAAWEPDYKGAVSVELLFVLPRPKSLPKRRVLCLWSLAAKRPDLDKIARALL